MVGPSPTMTKSLQSTSQFDAANRLTRKRAATASRTVPVERFIG
jgi:hypothetical protein